MKGGHKRRRNGTASHNFLRLSQINSSTTVNVIKLQKMLANMYVVEVAKVKIDVWKCFFKFFNLNKPNCVFTTTHFKRKRI